MFINIDYPQFCLYFVRVIKKKESQKKFIIFDFLQSLQDKTPIILLLTFFIYISVSLSVTKKIHTCFGGSSVKLNEFRQCR